MSATTTAKEKEAYQLVRFDKNLAHNIFDYSVFKEFQDVTKDLSIYMAYKYANARDLFGMIKIDPYEFGAKMGYDRTNLFRNLKGDKYKKEIGTKMVDGKAYRLDTFLEHCLFLMGERNINLTYEGTTWEGGKKVKVKFVQILEDLEIHIDKSNTKKRAYFVRPAEKFIKSLARNYVNLNIDVLPQLRRAKVYDLYLYLKALKEICRLKREHGTPSFDLLVKYAGIESDKAAYKKTKVIRKFNKMVKLAELNWELRWERNGKYYYKPVVRYPDNQIHQTELQKQKTSEDQDKFYQKVYQHQLGEVYHDVYLASLPENIVALDFMEWYRHKNLNRVEKAESYIKAQEIVYNKIMKLDDVEVIRKFKLHDIVNN